MKRRAGECGGKTRGLRSFVAKDAAQDDMRGCGMTPRLFCCSRKRAFARYHTFVERKLGIER
jgi:hypothetical protein